MTIIRSIILLAVATILSCSCVSRTVSSSTQNRGANTKDQDDGKVLQKKIIWIWQDEYRNP